MCAQYYILLWFQERETTEERSHAYDGNTPAKGKGGVIFLNSTDLKHIGEHLLGYSNSACFICSGYVVPIPFLANSYYTVCYGCIQ